VVVLPKRAPVLPAASDKVLERVASTRAELLAARGAYSEAVLAASAAGVTQRRIAAAAGVTQQTIQLLLSKERES
jgi:predicted transcriptional regulator